MELLQIVVVSEYKAFVPLMTEQLKAAMSLIDAAMKYRDSILVGRVVPNALRRLGDKPPYHRSRKSQLQNLMDYHEMVGRVVPNAPHSSGYGGLRTIRPTSFATTSEVMG